MNPEQLRAIKERRAYGWPIDGGDYVDALIEAYEQAVAADLAKANIIGRLYQERDGAEDDRDSWRERAEDCQQRAQERAVNLVELGKQRAERYESLVRRMVKDLREYRPVHSGHCSIGLDGECSCGLHEVKDDLAEAERTLEESE